MTQNSVTPLWIILITVALVFVFFVPWIEVSANLAQSVKGIGAKVDNVAGDTGWLSKVTDKASELVSKVKLSGKLAKMSGYDIAKSNNNVFVGLVGDMMIFVNQKDKDPRQVKMLYLLPVIAIVLGLIMLFSKMIHPLIKRFAGVIALCMGGFMLYKLATTPLAEEIADVKLLWGIWATGALFVMQGFVGLFKD